MTNINKYQDLIIFLMYAIINSIGEGKNMKLEIKKSRIIMNIISIFILFAYVVLWLIFSYNVILPWGRSLFDGLGDWFSDQGPGALALIIPLVFAGLGIFILIITCVLGPILLFAMPIIFIILSLVAKKKWMFIILTILGFISLSILPSITSILVLKDNSINITNNENYIIDKPEE